MRKHFSAYYWFILPQVWNMSVFSSAFYVFNFNNTRILGNCIPIHNRKSISSEGSNPWSYRPYFPLLTETTWKFNIIMYGLRCLAHISPFVDRYCCVLNLVCFTSVSAIIFVWYVIPQRKFVGEAMAAKKIWKPSPKSMYVKNRFL